MRHRRGMIAGSGGVRRVDLSHDDKSVSDVEDQVEVRAALEMRRDERIAVGSLQGTLFAGQR